MTASSVGWRAVQQKYVVCYAVKLLMFGLLQKNCE